MTFDLSNLSLQHPFIIGFAMVFFPALVATGFAVAVKIIKQTTR